MKADLYLSATLGQRPMLVAAIHVSETLRPHHREHLIAHTSAEAWASTSTPSPPSHFTRCSTSSMSCSSKPSSKHAKNQRPW